VIGVLNLKDMRCQQPGSPAVHNWSAVPPTSMHGPLAACSADTVGSSVSTGVSQIAASLRSATTGADKDASDLPMTMGAATPADATVASIAAVTCPITHVRS
jgi:hypothetical protein